MINVLFTFQIFVIAIIAFLVISSWTEVITRWMMDKFNWEKEKISTWIKIGIISIVALIIIVILFNIEIHDLLGISETVDKELTGKYEKFQNGKVRHYTIK